MSSRRDRELERAQRLLRRLDLEEVLDELGIDVLYYRGSDAYCECPDPEHDDANPSFHVCVEDVTDERGRDRIGAYNCWSHPGDGLRGLNFLDLVARVLFGIWGEDAEGFQRWPREEDRDRAAAWLRRTFLDRDDGDLERLRNAAAGRRKRARVVLDGELIFPPSRPIAEADPRFQIYLERRWITPERARELGVVAVEIAGRALSRTLGETVPAVLFPIRWDGAVVNWFARALSPRAPKKAKGRYAPRVLLGKRGVLWLPDPVDFGKPLVLVEGIFDAERVRRLILERRPPGLVPGNVGAVLGGRLTSEQARRLRGFSLVIHLADGDAGGKTLGESIQEQLESFVRVVSKPLPDGTDPGDAPEEVLLEALELNEERSARVVRRIRKSRR
jgi:hypothetical protein